MRGYLQEAGLETSAADRRVGGYSKGMRQKVGIAIAIAKKAQALLLDEPTSELDPKAANDFSDLLKRLGGRGVAILMATHDLFRAKEKRDARGDHETPPPDGIAFDRRYRACVPTRQ